MNLQDYQRWLCEEQWNGFPLDRIVTHSAPDSPGPSAYEVRALRSLAIITAGICGEAGEASEHFKKWMRDGRLNKREAGIELGDTLAYLTWLAKSLGYTLEDIAALNHEKLVARGAPTPR